MGMALYGRCMAAVWLLYGCCIYGWGRIWYKVQNL
jgi:hypothetical protein